MVAYFIRGGGEGWAVIKLRPGDREEVVQGGMNLAEAEQLRLTMLEDIRRSAPQQSELRSIGTLRRDASPND